MPPTKALPVDFLDRKTKQANTNYRMHLILKTTQMVILNLM